MIVAEGLALIIVVLKHTGCQEIEKSLKKH
jgi:hypothetical protein